MQLLGEKQARKRFGRLAKTKSALRKLVDEGVGGIHLKAVTIDGERWYRPEAIDEFIKQLGDAVLRHVRGSLAATKVQPGLKDQHRADTPTFASAAPGAAEATTHSNRGTVEVGAETR